ncbi:unnamed protein product [Agarophyton chilense]
MSPGDLRIPDDVNRTKHILQSLIELAKIRDGKNATVFADTAVPHYNGRESGSLIYPGQSPDLEEASHECTPAVHRPATPTSAEENLPRRTLVRKLKSGQEEDLTAVIKLMTVNEQR